MGLTTVEIIERSVYDALLQMAIAMGHTLDPLDYYPITPESIQQYQDDLAKIEKPIYIFGAGNNQSKGQKVTPRIVVESHGLYPGGIGLPREILEKKQGIGYQATEVPYESLDQYMDIRLVAESQEDNRIMHNIMFYALPQRGYIKPWPSKEFQKSGNIFIEVVNFFNRPDFAGGIIEKVYQFAVLDCILAQPKELPTVPSINEINLLIETTYETNKLNVKQ